MVKHVSRNRMLLWFCHKPDTRQGGMAAGILQGALQHCARRSWLTAVLVCYLVCLALLTHHEDQGVFPV
jgi:hypothetical protein